MAEWIWWEKLRGGEAATRLGFQRASAGQQNRRGHRDFLSTFDPAITPREAASRRDFTINAMAYDPVVPGVDGLFRRPRRSGIADSARHQRRVFRRSAARSARDAVRLPVRFDARSAKLPEMSRSIAEEYSTIAKERIAEEFMKWATKADHPGRIGEYLIDTGWMIHFPEIERIYGVPQDPEWHPEGDVGMHTMLVVDEAARDCGSRFDGKATIAQCWCSPR